MGEPPSRQSATLDEKFEALRESYRSRMPEHLDRMAVALESACAAPGPTTLQDAFQLAHRLKGTSGSFGFLELAAELEAIEEILDRARRAGTPLTEGEREAVSAALARARALPV